MLVFGRGQSVKFTVVRFMQNFCLFESDKFALFFVKRRLLSKDKDCMIAAKVIPPFVICIKIVSFMLENR